MRAPPPQCGHMLSLLLHTAVDWCSQQWCFWRRLRPTCSSFPTVPGCWCLVCNPFKDRVNVIQTVVVFGLQSVHFTPAQHITVQDFSRGVDSQIDIDSSQLSEISFYLCFATCSSVSGRSQKYCSLEWVKTFLSDTDWPPPVIRTESGSKTETE